MQQTWYPNFDRTAQLINMGIGTQDFFSTIEKELPPVVSRVELARITGGLISVKTLSNEDSLQKGPGERIRVGTKIGYSRVSAMTYLRKKLKPL